MTVGVALQAAAPLGCIQSRQPGAEKNLHRGLCVGQARGSTNADHPVADCADKAAARPMTVAHPSTPWQCCSQSSVIIEAAMRRDRARNGLRDPVCTSHTTLCECMQYLQVLHR